MSACYHGGTHGGLRDADGLRGCRAHEGAAVLCFMGLELAIDFRLSRMLQQQEELVYCFVKSSAGAG